LKNVSQHNYKGCCMKRYTQWYLLSISIMGVGIYADCPNVVFCTFFTPSHEKLAREWMIPSITDDVPLIIGTSEQKCKTATYFKEGWTATMRDKVDFIVKVLTEHRGEIVVFVDPDIIFFRPVKERIIELLTNLDFVGQREKPEDGQDSICTGFFAMRANDAVIAAWKATRALMDTNDALCDQGAFNTVLFTQNDQFRLRWAHLPQDEFFGGGTFREIQWKPDRALHIPQNPRMFHANYTSFRHKEEMLKLVKDTVLHKKKRIQQRKK
jgi:nucleotide-diphospho-sugar transferase